MTRIGKSGWLGDTELTPAIIRAQANGSRAFIEFFTASIHSPDGVCAHPAFDLG